MLASTVQHCGISITALHCGTAGVSVRYIMQLGLLQLGLTPLLHCSEAGNVVQVWTRDECALATYADVMHNEFALGAYHLCISAA